VSGGQALLLVGHGSHLSADSSTPVHEHAARIRAMGLFDEVETAFWKEEPELRYALDLVGSEDVFVVPLFLAEGYFTRQVVPRELGIGPTSIRDRRVGEPMRVHYCRPVGTHPSMAGLIVRRAREATGRGEGSLADLSLLIIGHGSGRSSTSGDTVYRLVERLRAGGLFADVDCGFLDEEPGIDAVLANARGREVVLVPFFVAEGWHTRLTIPRDLGLVGEGDRFEVDGRVVWYTRPIGTLPEITSVILEVAADAGAMTGGRPDEQGLDAVRAPAAPTGRDSRAHTTRDAPVTRAREDFLAWVDAAGEAGRDFLQLTIRQAGLGYTLRHVDDAGADEASLAPLATAAAALGVSRATRDGGYRPLRTAPDLRAGWILRDLDAGALWEAASLVYPTAALHWHEARRGTLEVIDFPRTAARQTGIYRTIGALTGESLDRAVSACCDRAVCLRENRWGAAAPLAGEAEPRTAGANGSPTRAVLPSPRDGDGPAREAEVPCPEPCSLFVSFAREAAEWEGLPAIAADGAASAAELSRALQRAAAVIGARHSATVEAGEFDDWLNPRRLRWIASRVEAGPPAGDDAAAGSLRLAWEVGSTEEGPLEDLAVAAGASALVALALDLRRGGEEMRLAAGVRLDRDGPEGGVVCLAVLAASETDGEIFPGSETASGTTKRWLERWAATPGRLLPALRATATVEPAAANTAP